ncbi:MAG: hypothetical protein P8R38_06635 [Planctomycetota bacterium]|nr:hypothetical protein [Planctomycetota bacterium]MDG2085308.1 hypothetical protein [Planctomycetota bacterium]
MEQQNSESGRQPQPTAEKTNEFTKMWEELGQGGKLIFSLFIFFLAYNIFGGTSSGTWIDVNEAKASDASHEKVVSEISNDSIEYKYNKDGVLQVRQKDVAAVLSILDQYVPREKEAVDTAKILPPLNNFFLPQRTRKVTGIREIVLETEQDVSQFEGVTAVNIVPNRKSIGKQGIGLSQAVSRVNVTLTLDSDAQSLGLSSNITKAISKLISVAFDVSERNIDIFDTVGRSYDIAINTPTSADIQEKSKLITDQVSRYMGQILEPENFKVQVDIGYSEIESASVESAITLEPGILNIRDAIINFAPITGPLPPSVVNRQSIQNAKAQLVNQRNRQMGDIAVTVFVDREITKSILDPGQYDDPLNFSPVIAVPHADSFQSVMQDISVNLEEHLNATFAESAHVTAKLIPVNLIGAQGKWVGSSFQFADTNFAASVPVENNQNSTIFFFTVFSILMVVLMFREGPKNKEKRFSVAGFHGGYIEKDDFSSSGSFAGFVSQLSSDEEPPVIQQILKKSFFERIEILKAIAKNIDELPGTGVLALMIFDLAESRQEIFKELEESECEVLFSLVDKIETRIDEDDIEDAFAVFELLSAASYVESESPVLVTTVETRPEIDDRVMEDIRSTNPALADLIKKNRSNNDSGEVS